MKQIVFTCLLLLIPALNVIAAEITLVADEWPPFNGSPGSEYEGYMVDVAREVFAKKGITVKYRVLPWNRSLRGTEIGKYNGAIGASKTDAEGFIFPEEELARNRLAFYVKKGSQWKFNGLKSIKTISLGVIDGYDYRIWLNRYIEQNRQNPAKVQVLVGDSPLAQNLKKLLAGRIDVVVDTDAAIRSAAKHLNVLEQIEVAGYGDEPAFCYIAFSPVLDNSSHYAKILSDGIVEMRKSGRLIEILDKYGLHDWK